MPFSDDRRDRGGVNRRALWRWIVEAAICAGLIVLCLFAIGAFTFQRFQPPRGTTTLDQLVADLPETLKFGVVKQAGRTYIVWIGRSRGPIVSGPPVYVFDDKGILVDYTRDVGDDDKRFINDCYGEAWRGSDMTARQALEFCRRK